jgi:hypothetical protein
MALDLCAGISVGDYPDGMREALYRDPEGNEIWFGGAPAA